MKKKIFALIFILLLTLTSTVFAANADNQVQKLNSDVYNDRDELHNLDSQVSGNVFSVSNKFEMMDVSSISGNLYAICKTANLKSNVTYSNSVSKDGSTAIESVNSHSTIEGNGFIICNEFILEPGAEINGDLYIIANKVDIQKSSAIYGNLFAVSSEIILNGRVGNSVYASSNNFTMGYYGSISKDLHLSCENVTLSSVIHRNAYISSNTISTSQDFLLYGDLKADSHKFNFSGEVNGNATINSKELNFVANKDNEPISCLISGDLNYSSKNELQIENGIVNGTVSHSKYLERIDNKLKFNFKYFIINLITFVVYILGVILVFNILNKKYKGNKHEITVKNAFVSLGIGFLSFVAVIVVSMLLIVTHIGATLGLALIFTYLFLLFTSIPMFVLDIALSFKNKYNLYLASALIAVILYIITMLPFVGGIIFALFMFTGIGRTCSRLLIKKK